MSLLDNEIVNPNSIAEAGVISALRVSWGDGLTNHTIQRQCTNMARSQIEVYEGPPRHRGDW